MTSVDRLLKYLEFKGIKKSVFYSNTSLSNGYLDKVKELGADKIESIISIYDEINLDWLITGKGKMIRNIDDNKDVKFIPLYDSILVKNKNNTYTNPAIKAPVEYINAGDWFNDADAAMRVYGESMAPDYSSGSIIVMKELHDKQLILYGNDYVIETQEYRVLKRLQKGKSRNTVKAHSINKRHWEDGSLMFESIEVNLKDIKHLFLVLGVIGRFHSV